MRKPEVGDRVVSKLNAERRGVVLEVRDNGAYTWLVDGEDEPVQATARVLVVEG